MNYWPRQEEPEPASQADKDTVEKYRHYEWRQ